MSTVAVSPSLPVHQTDTENETGKKKEKPVKVEKTEYPVAGAMIRTAWDAAFAAFVAHSFTIVSPGTAAVFGAIESLVRNELHSCLIKDDVTAKNFLSAMTKSIAIFAVSNASGAFLSKAIGYPLTLKAAVTLSLATYATSLAIQALIVGGLCCCCGAILAIAFASGHKLPERA